MRIPSSFRERAGVELQLTPMIDCVFLLMVYFIWSSSFAVAELSLPSRLSAQTSGSDARSIGAPPEADFESVVVRVLWIGGQPAWTINDAPQASLAQVRQTLTAIARIQHDVPVIIDPASDVPLGDVIDAFDLTRLAGFSKVQFAATSSRE
jgi:biopolymer transport protein ExbD